MDANAACSEIPSEYSVFMCKAETLHYLHVCLLHAAAVFQALKCAFLPRDGRYFTFLESVTSDRLLSDRGPISFFFVQIYRNKLGQNQWAASVSWRVWVGWCYSNCWCHCSQWLRCCIPGSGLRRSPQIPPLTPSRPPLELQSTPEIAHVAVKFMCYFNNRGGLNPLSVDWG